MKKWILIALSLTLWSLSEHAQSQSGQKGQDAGGCVTHTVTNETANTSHTITRCLNDAVVDFEDEKPAPKTSKPKEEKNPSIHRYPFSFFTDLDAQKSMAESTYAIKKFTLWGIGIGFFGLFFIGWTLKATRDAASAANRAAEAAERSELPYVFVTIEPEFVEEKDTIFRDGLSSRARVIVRIKNYGKSPATKVRYAISLNAIDSESKNYAFGRGGDSGQEIVLGDGDEITSSLPEFEIMFYWWEHDLPRHYLISCAYSYADSRGEPIQKNKIVNFIVHPTATMEIFDWLKLNVCELTSKKYTSYCNDNANYKAPK